MVVRESGAPACSCTESFRCPFSPAFPSFPCSRRALVSFSRHGGGTSPYRMQLSIPRSASSFFSLSVVPFLGESTCLSSASLQATSKRANLKHTPLMSQNLASAFNRSCGQVSLVSGCVNRRIERRESSETHMAVMATHSPMPSSSGARCSLPVARGDTHAFSLAGFPLLSGQSPSAEEEVETRRRTPATPPCGTASRTRPASRPRP